MKKGKKGIKAKQISNIPLDLNQEHKQIYATGAFGGFTNYDFRLFFYNEVPKQTGKHIETVELVPESKYEIVMSIKTVKELHIWLGEKIKEVEDVLGEEIKTTKDDFEALKKRGVI